MKNTILFIMLISFTVILNADPDRNSRVDTTATINSFSSLGEFYTIEYSGEYQEIMDYLDDIYLGSQSPGLEQLGCSLFSGFGEPDNIFLGRNFDNQQQDALVGKYSAEGCYESIALNRLADLGLPVGTNFQNLSTNQEMQLLKAPYFATDGINETGLAVGIAYVDAMPVEVDPEKDKIFITRWVREVLDHAATVEEAVEISNNYNILDNMFGQNTLCHHLLVTDRNGNSVILEYHDGGFEAIYPEVEWQVLTNTHIYNHTLEQMFYLCYRYELLYDALEVQNGIIYDWRNALEILELPTWGNVSNGTQWSNVFDLNENYMYLSLFRDFDNIVRVDVETFDFVNFGDFYLEDLVIQDADGDGNLESGEQVYIIPTVSVDFNSYGVEVELSTEDLQVVFLNNESDYGDILPGEIAHNATDPFLIQIPAEPAESIVFTLTFTTSYGYSYETDFTVQVAGTSSEDNALNAESVRLQNYPNPFNPSTTISFDLTTRLRSNDRNYAGQAKDTELLIYNIKGQKVKDLSPSLCHPSVAGRGPELVEVRGESIYSITWNGTDDNGLSVPSGIYYYKLKAGDFEQTKKMLLLK